MNYNESVDYIHSLLKFGMNLGLERISALLEELGNPQNGLKYIHIAGTNGKGTTSTMLSEILKSAGYKTGLFTSPYVFDFCERIQINNQNISKSDLAETVTVVKKAVDIISKNGIEPTEFEAITAAALLYFYKQNCDYAVMEVGLGGKYDSTNIIPCPKVSVITSVSLDHMQILGDTIEKIAIQKCGIIKEGATVVTSSLQHPDALKIIRKTVSDKNGRLIVADASLVKITDEKISKTSFQYLNRDYIVNLAGEHQIENTIGVIEAAKQIDGVDFSNIYNGISNTVMHGRMELIKDNVLIDGGHNEECALALKRVLERFCTDKKITAVIGMMADKEYEKYLAYVLPLCDSVVFTCPDNPRSEQPEVLAKTAQQYIKKIIVENSPATAYDKAVGIATENGLVLVCGSFYLLSDIFGNNQ